MHKTNSFLTTTSTFPLLFLLLLLLLHPATPQTESLLNHIHTGYQGWFTTQADGSNNGWTHFKMHSDKPFARDNCVIDFWPDTTEYEKKYPVGEFGDGVFLYSAYDYGTVRTHFRWMQEGDIDGVFLQRFGSDIKNKGSNMWKFKNKVLENVMNATKETNRYWSLMYDLSGLNLGQIRSIIMQDYKYLHNTYNFTSSPSYTKHKGRPLVTIWGVGFNDKRMYTLAECAELVDFFKNGQYGGHSVMLGVPRYWRDGGKDAVTGAQLKYLHNIVMASDVVSPWTVGRYGTIDQARNDARIQVKADLALCNQYKVTLMPVIFPGFSWHNLQVSGQNPDHPGPYNQIPRKQNNTYLLQVQGSEIAKVGAKTMYVAMFDEMNEGTAIFKCSRNPPSLADGLRFVEYQEEADFYMKMVGRIGKMIK